MTTLLLGGCANYIPFAYEVPVQQGNIITQDMLKQLRVGMTRKQVRYVLGTPAVEDPFHADRWDYVYSVERNHEPMKVDTLTVIFRDDKLAYVEGDLAPASLQQSSAGQS